MRTLRCEDSGIKSWGAAHEAAAAIAPARVWRRDLARALRRVPEALAATVFTCPPNMPFDARGDGAPLRALSTAHHFIEHLLRNVQSQHQGTMMARQLGSRAYGPLASATDPVLARRAREQIVTPLGAADLVNAFLIVGESQVVGWLSVWVTGPVTDVLPRFGPPLTCVARQASLTLEAALGLAAGCGAVAPSNAATRNRYNAAFLTKANASSDRVIAGTVTWGITEVPIVIGGLEVPAQTSLTLGAGVIVKVGAGGGVRVLSGGTFTWAGATLTSIKDDSRGGDTNGDGPSSGAFGDWQGVTINANWVTDPAILYSEH